MNKILKFYSNFHLSKKVYLLILIAFCFSVVARMYWVYWASSYEPFFYNNELMISTNDGYAFAEGARDMLAGFHQPNDLSYFGSSLSTLTFWIVKLLDFKLESVMLYMSVFFSSLIVIPIILISNIYNNTKAGFLAALIASVANSYYNRTMAGYYDTDMLTIVLPCFIIWGLIRVCEHKRHSDIIIAPIFIIIYHWWYASGFTLISATIGLFVAYTLITERKNLTFYSQIALLILAISNFNLLFKILIIFGFYFVFLYKNHLFSFKAIMAFLSISIIIFIAGGGLNPIIFQAKFYLFRDSSEIANISFKYFNVNQTIQESSIIPFELFAKRISGHVITFILSLVGVVYLCMKNRSFLLSLAMLTLGFLALKGGLRFTIYAVPIMAIGFGFFITKLLEILKISKNFVFNTCFIAITILALFPIAIHIQGYKISPVFMQSEVEVLDEFKNIADREDYALAWWDYGYPIRYYSDVKTLIDGGKHLGRDNFAVSFALGETQTRSANIARLEVEYTERNFTEKFGTNLSKMLQDYNIDDVNEFLSQLDNKNFKLPKKTRDIFYFLPDRMIYIYPTILQFSRLDLKDGKQYSNPLFFISENFSQNSNYIDMGRIRLFNTLDKIAINNEILNINTFIETKYDENEKLQIKKLQNDTNSNIYVIFMRDYGRFLVLDESMFNSTFIKLFVLEDYDERLFEPVILDGAAKIYRLKR
ncbi:Undecaprenyl-diphosphooligosaccharide--protein glycotransferase [Campylobacter majalis]|uniref:Undecaprenyl-diphosphooligosaccharide--protein glycotransferase n=1 Tax=Campylobacter majalis TaxID=2790656 RepID=A0ABN7KAT9_9BACT|nr:STT3 domain-containing protein [Campylobacter majalis]CAD7289669.1 Undecaprenyl-diphosphooligosaccharide--protein glycotransferase [Campylobacter majalis]